MRRNNLSLLFIFLLSFLTISSNCFSQSQKVTGVVYSFEDKSPLPFVVVNVKGTSISTAANEDGKYEITVPHPTDTLVYVMVAMMRHLESVNARSNINVYLKKDKVELKEVVVTALGIKKEKKALGYACSRGERRGFTNCQRCKCD